MNKIIIRTPTPLQQGGRYVFGSQRNKDIVTYDGCDVNGIHHTGGICRRGGCHRGAGRQRQEPGQEAGRDAQAL